MEKTFKVILDANFEIFPQKEQPKWQKLSFYQEKLKRRRKRERDKKRNHG